MDNVQKKKHYYRVENCSPGWNTRSMEMLCFQLPYLLFLLIYLNFQIVLYRWQILVAKSNFDSSLSIYLLLV
jgi:hypothetical protein